ncbi:hypothetical protein KI387_029483, partial [Taxus chinensis]
KGFQNLMVPDCSVSTNMVGNCCVLPLDNGSLDYVLPLEERSTSSQLTFFLRPLLEPKYYDMVLLKQRHGRTYLHLVKKPLATIAIMFVVAFVCILMSNHKKGIVGHWFFSEIVTRPSRILTTFQKDIDNTKLLFLLSCLNHKIILCREWTFTLGICHIHAQYAYLNESDQLQRSKFLEALCHELEQYDRITAVRISVNLGQVEDSEKMMFGGVNGRKFEGSFAEAAGEREWIHGPTQNIEGLSKKEEKRHHEPYASNAPVRAGGATRQGQQLLVSIKIDDEYAPPFEQNNMPIAWPFLTPAPNIRAHMQRLKEQGDRRTLIYLKKKLYELPPRTSMNEYTNTKMEILVLSKLTHHNFTGIDLPKRAPDCHRDLMMLESEFCTEPLIQASQKILKAWELIAMIQSFTIGD